MKNGASRKIKKTVKTTGLYKHGKGKNKCKWEKIRREKELEKVAETEEKVNTVGEIKGVEKKKGQRKKEMQRLK